MKIAILSHKEVADYYAANLMQRWHEITALLAAPTLWQSSDSVGESQRCPKGQCKKKRSFRPTVLLHCIESPEAAPPVINLDVEEDWDDTPHIGS
jgi:hypothetical protein